MGGDISLFTSDASSTLPVMNYLALLSASFSSAPVRPHYILFPFFHSPIQRCVRNRLSLNF